VNVSPYSSCIVNRIVILYRMEHKTVTHRLMKYCD
jgi:hypothetical protein